MLSRWKKVLADSRDYGLGSSNIDNRAAENKTETTAQSRLSNAPPISGDTRVAFIGSIALAREMFSDWLRLLRPDGRGV